MSNVIAEIEQEQMQALNPKIPKFHPGDTLRVEVRVTETSGRERLQGFEGVVIAKRNRGLHSSFTLRHLSKGVERVFQTYSPMIANIKLKRRGDVRRSKLYYLRALTGRMARIKEKIIKKK